MNSQETNRERAYVRITFMKNVYNDFKNSFYCQDFYESVLEKPFSKGVAFVLILTALSTFVVGVKFYLTVIPDIKEFISEENVLSLYPDELEVTIEQGVVTTNVDEPYTINFPGWDVDLKEENKLPSNFIVIDTSNGEENTALGDIRSYDAMFILMSDSFAVQEDNGEIRIIPLKDVESFTLNEEILGVLVSKFAKWLPVIIGVLSIIAWAGATLGMFAIYLLSLVFLSVIPFAVSRIKGGNFSYKESYKFSLYALGPVILLDAIDHLVDIRIAFWVTIVVVLAVSIANIKRVETHTDEIHGFENENLEEENN